MDVFSKDILIISSRTFPLKIIIQMFARRTSILSKTMKFDVVRYTEKRKKVDLTVYALRLVYTSQGSVIASIASTIV